MTAASFILQSQFVASTLETGRIGYVNGWGGSDYGYLYTYTATGLPSGVTLGSTYGILSIGTAVATPGVYPFTVTVTNYLDATQSATFQCDLTILPGVSGVPTAGQIQSKTYNPDSGTWGSPVGTDYTNVFASMKAAILSDQATAGDGNLRATINLRRGLTYQVNGAAANGWLTGVQYYLVQPDPAFPSGANPIIQNISNNATQNADGPINFGGGSALDHTGSIKSSSATIASANLGDETVTVLSGLSNIVQGRWHVICGGEQSGSGTPPNCAAIDYVKVVGINGSVLTLDRPLRYRYDSTWYENTSNDASLGVARIIPWDCGGTGGQTPSDPRMTFRAQFANITFADNPTITSSATWIAPEAVKASTLETGDIVQITAWGGAEYGYAYTFTLDGTQPAGVTIGKYTGRLNIGSALSVGVYTFGVIATNMENTLASQTFSFTLTVLAAVTSGTPTTSQIRHATFDPGSGTWGTPTGNDWTSVFNSMQTAILSLQTTCNAAWDESLRVTIPLQRGTTYQYTGNGWLQGIQYLRVVDAGTGALPILQCTRSDPGGSNPYADGPLNIGLSGSMSHQGTIKAKSATIATVAAGSTTVTLLNTGDESKIVAGRWHTVIGQVTQIGGYPPNEGFIDYVKVTSISGTTVTLDRPLKYGYSQTWWEDNSDDNSLGVARLVPFDTGGTGGYIPADPRCFIRAYILNMNMLGNPNTPGGPNANGSNIAYVQSAIDFTFDSCNIPNAQITMSKHYYLNNVTQTWFWEPDKQCETLIINNGINQGQAIGGATGFQYFLVMNSHVGEMQIAPRQFRSISTHHDGTGDGSWPGSPVFYGPPVTTAAGGPFYYWDFGSQGACSFTKGSDSHWTYAFNPGSDAASLTLGTNATFSGSQLQIPHSFSGFNTWLIWATAGSIVSTVNGAPFTTNWGYVSSVSSDGLGTSGHLYLNIVWVNGTQPSSGQLYLSRRSRLFFASGNTFTSGTLWASPGFAKETASPNEGGWNYPTGYPALTQTAPVGYGYVGIVPGTVRVESTLDLQFDTCTMGTLAPTMCDHVYLNACTVMSAQIGNFIDTLGFDASTTVFPNYNPTGSGTIAGIAGSMGVQSILTRTTTHGCFQSSARQFRSLGSSFDSRSDTNLLYPFNIGSQGAMRDYRFAAFGATNSAFFSGGQNSGDWTPSQAGNVNLNAAVIGTDVSFNHLSSGANVLYIPSTYANFAMWEERLWEGALLYQADTTSFPATANWGRVQMLSSPGDGTGIYATLAWLGGTVPSSGNLYPLVQPIYINVASGTVFNSPAIWVDPAWVTETTALGSTYGFPTGYAPPVTIQQVTGYSSGNFVGTTVPTGGGTVNGIVGMTQSSYGNFVGTTSPTPPSGTWTITMGTVTGTIVTSGP